MFSTCSASFALLLREVAPNHESHPRVLTDRPCGSIASCVSEHLVRCQLHHTARGSCDQGKASTLHLASAGDVHPGSLGLRQTPSAHVITVKRIALLGATGSIGRQALEIVAAHPELELCAIASGSQDLSALVAEHGVEHVQVGGDLTALLERAEPDLVLNAVVGFANKESLVVAGELALAAWERGGGLLLPVDSEHSAAFQCLEGRPRESVDTLVLTASGGPFRGRNRSELVDVTPEDALAHPTWNMGPKITIDSATLANKGLELIEAHFLFDLPYDRIEVVVHPSSIVHSLVRFRDGAALAHLGYPDMRVPISFALTYPERAATPLPQLDLASGLTLEFQAPDLETFPLPALARAAGER